LQAEYGIGKLTSVVVWCELGDTRRFTSSAQAVRHTGLDVTIYSSDGKRGRAHIARPGSAVVALGVG
jgi:transposase